MGLDYKKCVEILRWHALYSDLNGTEAKVLMLMITNANYKTGVFIGSQMEIAELIGASKQSVNKAIAELQNMEAIVETKLGKGRMPSAYKIRTNDDLDVLFRKTEKNQAREEWYIKRENLFGEVEAKMYEMCEGCEDCTEKVVCERCTFRMNEYKKREDYRRLMLWESDNPKPPMNVETIRGRLVT
jgi:biotin operon repressor